MTQEKNRTGQSCRSGRLGEHIGHGQVVGRAALAQDFAGDHEFLQVSTGKAGCLRVALGLAHVEGFGCAVDGSERCRAVDEAAFDYANENGAVNEWEDFLHVASTVVNDKSFSTCLDNPAVSAEHKSAAFGLSI